jgi:succinate dehydrogenase/fumarate reductase flavoprotein subunit
METQAEASRLVMGDVLGRDRAVRAVIYTNHRTGVECTVRANAVVLATGGYISDRGASSLLAEANAQLCSMPTSCGSHADGRGMRMARAVGAELVDMHQLQVDPCGIINQKDPSSMQKDLCPSLIRSAGAILVNGQGRRFCNELDSTQKMTAALVKECGHHKAHLSSGREQPVAYLLINMAVLSRIEQDGASILQHQDAGQSFGSVQQFCEAMGVPAQNLQDTFTKYAQ